MAADVTDFPNLLVPLISESLSQTGAQFTATSIAAAVGAYQQFLAHRASGEVGDPPLMPAESVNLPSIGMARQQSERQVLRTPILQSRLPFRGQSQTVLRLGGPRPKPIDHH